MAIETASYITGLNEANPSSLDTRKEGDDHIRMLKAVLKASFPNVNGPVNATPTQLNSLATLTDFVKGLFAQADAASFRTAIGALDSTAMVANASALVPTNDYQVRGLGVGVAKNTGWGTAWGAVDLLNGGALYCNSGGLGFLSNSYIDGSGVARAKTTGVGSIHWIQPDGASTWQKAPSVAAGEALSFSTLLTLDANGNLTATGNVTMGSDPSLKANWRKLPKNFLSRLAKLQAGIYDRIDVPGLTQVGVNAAELRKFMRWAVQKGKDGLLSVSYGNAALVACVRLAEEVEELKVQNKLLERRLTKLEK